MTRDPRLHGLSSDHHHALVLARSVAARAGRADAAAQAAREVADRFATELEPHFRVEEEVLLPALARAGEHALVARTERDHAFLRETAAEAREGRTERLGAFAERLTEHVRFEERELFPRCEQTLAPEVLDEVARRRPKAGPPAR
jgi:hemerythrin-like domain-containing protein